MLTAHDELMCHQLTTTFDHVDQSDLRWTERVVLYGFDRQTLTSVMTGMARYPNRNVIDAYAMVTVDGRAHVVRTSREISAAVDGIASWQVGNYGYEVTEPLRRVRAVLEPGEGVGALPRQREVPPPACWGTSMELDFTGTFPCYEQAPAFFRHRGRVDEDARRFYQNGQASGSITMGDKRIAITPEQWYFRPRPLVGGASRRWWRRSAPSRGVAATRDSRGSAVLHGYLRIRRPSGAFRAAGGRPRRHLAVRGRTALSVFDRQTEPGHRPRRARLQLP